MRDSRRAGLTVGRVATSTGPGAVLAAVLCSLSLACSEPTPTRVAVEGATAVGSGVSSPVKTAASERAMRRAYDGAPPVVPHENFGITCTECHDAEGMAIEDVGFAPPSPHEITAGMSAISRCSQCHVFKQSNDVFVGNRFSGLSQDLRSGARLNPLAPPTIPHKTFMRENCTACHSGAAAREEIRTSHPERTRCRQCHVPVTSRSRFVSG